jgi:hypothetical protein
MAAFANLAALRGLGNRFNPVGGPVPLRPPYPQRPIGQPVGPAPYQPPIQQPITGGPVGPAPLQPPIQRPIGQPVGPAPYQPGFPSPYGGGNMQMPQLNNLAALARMYPGMVSAQ